MPTPEETTRSRRDRSRSDPAGARPDRARPRRLRLAIVGPGRVGMALGRRLAQQGVALLGYVGRDGAEGRRRAEAAVAFAGAGRALQRDDLGDAHVVMLAVGDADLAAAVEAAAAATAAPGRTGLWLHTSGRHGLDVLAPLQRGAVRLGVLHPVVPFPDVETGLRGLPGRPAVVTGDRRARRALERLALWLGMTPLVGHDGDRARYHAACALAANGLTALRATVERVMAAAAVLDESDAAVVVDELMAAALDACRRRGARDALSGPVLRGDAATVAAHRRALQAVPGEPDVVYRALMVEALTLALARGLDAAAAARLRRVLGAAED